MKQSRGRRERTAPTAKPVERMTDAELEGELERGRAEVRRLAEEAARPAHEEADRDAGRQFLFLKPRRRAWK